MTDLLERAFAKASELPEDEQNRIAAALLDELADERKWDEAFESSQNELAALADEARAAYEAGKTEPLDPDQL
jgi:hypothetical protein